MSRRIERPGVRAGYDRWSASYDATPNPVVALDRRHTLRALDPRPGERVLDAGCGTGAHLAAVCGAGSRALLSSLVSEHLKDLRRFFRGCFGALRRGGGFVRLAWREISADPRLAEEIPGAARHVGRPLLLLVCAERAR